MVSIRVGGDYYYDPSPTGPVRDLLFIAGGIGINPILSMMEHHIFLQTQRSQSDIKPICQLLYSASTSDNLVFQVSDPSYTPRVHNPFFDLLVTLIMF